MFIRISILFSLCLAACAQDVRDLRLDQLDLSDRKIVEEIGRELSAADRLIFTTYAAVHGRSGALCGGKLVDRRGNSPETVGDAIEIMRFRTV